MNKLFLNTLLFTISSLMLSSCAINYKTTFKNYHKNNQLTTPENIDSVYYYYPIVDKMVSINDTIIINSLPNWLDYGIRPQFSKAVTNYFNNKTNIKLLPMITNIDEMLEYQIPIRKDMEKLSGFVYEKNLYYLQIDTNNFAINYQINNATIEYLKHKNIKYCLLPYILLIEPKLITLKETEEKSYIKSFATALWISANLVYYAHEVKEYGLYNTSYDNVNTKDGLSKKLKMVILLIDVENSKTLHYSEAMISINENYFSFNFSELVEPFLIKNLK